MNAQSKPRRPDRKQIPREERELDDWLKEDGISRRQRKRYLALAREHDLEGEVNLDVVE